MKNSKQVVVTQQQLMENTESGATPRGTTQIKREDEEGERTRGGGASESNSPGRENNIKPVVNIQQQELRRHLTALTHTESGRMS